MLKYHKIKELLMLLGAQIFTSLMALTIIITIIAFNNEIKSNMDGIYIEILLFIWGWGVSIYLSIIGIKSIRKGVGSNSFVIRDFRKKTYINAILFSWAFFPIIFTFSQYNESGYNKKEIKLATFNFIVLEFEEYVLQMQTGGEEGENIILEVKKLIKNKVMTKFIAFEFIFQKFIELGYLPKNHLETIQEKHSDKIFTYQKI